MLTLHQSSKQSASSFRIGLAVAGGGPVGAIYELGALRALDESIEGLRLNDLDIYVGVSAGAFIAASLANGISTAEMCRIFMGHPDAEFRFEPERFLKPAYREYFTRASKVPGILYEQIKKIAKNPLQASVSEVMSALSSAIPSGIFDNDTIHRFLEQVFEVPGRTNNFSELRNQLFVVAVDLDNGAAVRFGGSDHDEVAISRAVQASAALPGLYPPVKIGNRHYVDGALRRTLHASVALDQGVDLLFGINPLVPYDSGDQQHSPQFPVKELIQGGLPLILSQTFRALIQSRMKVGFEKYKKSHAAADLVLLEPNREDKEIFFTNIFSYASRSGLCEHAYQITRQELLSRADQLDTILKRHGYHLRKEVLQDPERTLLVSMKEDRQGFAPVVRNLNQSLDDLERLISRSVR